MQVQLSGEALNQHKQWREARRRIEGIKPKLVAVQSAPPPSRELSTVCGLTTIRATRTAFLVSENNELHLSSSIDRETIIKKSAMTTVQFMRNVVRVVGEGENVNMIDIMSPRRSAPIVKARFICIHLIISMTGFTLPRIGRFLNRDHTTILSARDRFKERLAGDPELLARVNSYRETLRPIAPKGKFSVNIGKSLLTPGWSLDTSRPVLASTQPPPVGPSPDK